MPVSHNKELEQELWHHEKNVNVVLPPKDHSTSLAMESYQNGNSEMTDTDFKEWIVRKLNKIQNEVENELL